MLYRIELFTKTNNISTIQSSHLIGTVRAAELFMSNCLANNPQLDHCTINPVYRDRKAPINYGMHTYGGYALCGASIWFGRNRNLHTKSHKKLHYALHNLPMPKYYPTR